MRPRALVVAIAALAGCADETAPAPPPPCAEPGLVAAGDGSCIAPGIAPDACAVGFEATGDASCRALLPAEPCPAGTMAVPGELTCREVAPCAEGRYGDIPIEPSALHVDQSASRRGADGSADRPFALIQDAIDAAAPGAMIAVAEGSYLENVNISGKAVRLFGRCPALVEIVGASAGGAAVRVASAEGVELHSLAVRGAGFGVAASGASVTLERVWIHDLARSGVDLADVLGPTSATVVGALVENTGGFGVYATAAHARVEASVVRGVTPAGSGAGQGLYAQPGPSGGAGGALELIGSVVEHCAATGLEAIGSQATVSGSVIRSAGGGGVSARVGLAATERSVLTLQASTVEQVREVGVVVEGSDALLEATLIRGVTAADDPVGYGIELLGNADNGARAAAELRGVVVEQTEAGGIVVFGGELDGERLLVRDTALGPDGQNGAGLIIHFEEPTATRASASIRESLVDRASAHGVFVSASDLELERTVVRDTQLNASGGHGQGVQLQDDRATGGATGTLTGVLIERSRSFGLVVLGSDVTVAASVIRATLGDARGLFGDGIAVVHDAADTEPFPARLALDRVAVADSRRAAVAVFGAELDIGASTLSCQVFDLDREPYLGSDPALTDRGGNRCGCPDASADCKAVSAALQAPAPLESR